VGVETVRRRPRSSASRWKGEGAISDNRLTFLTELGLFAGLGPVPLLALAEGGDHHAGGEYHDEVVALTAASDLLIHDAFLFPDELARDAHLGHAVTEYPIALARVAGAKAVSLFHHRPSRTDDALDVLADRCQGGAAPVTVAIEGSTVDL
jgi:hypothetical protein